MAGAGTRRFDAVVVGASLGGLASAAILTNRGWRVAVVDALERPGGRVGAVEYDGYWIDWGHRDGHGIGDLAFAAIVTRQAAEAAGVELHLRPFVGSCVRVHWLPENTFTEMPAELVLADQGDPMERARALCRFFGGVTENLDQVAKEFIEAMAKLALTEDDEAWRLVPVKMGDWLARNVPNPAVRNVILQQCECIPFTPAVETSVGRYIFFLKTIHGQAVMADDPEAGGTAGLIRPWVRAIEERGGELLMGWKPLEIMVEDREARGVVALNRNQFVRVLEAPVVITDHPGWRLPDLVDERLLPKSFVDAARDVERYAADMICWWAGLGRLPTRRADGKVEDFSSPWNRILSGSSAVRGAYGGFLYPSGFSSRSAPAGKHLLVVWLAPSGEVEGRTWRSWRDARRAMDVNVDYLREHYYRDLDECVEWSHYQYCTPPSYLSWYVKPIYRHPVKVSTIEGLYVAGSTSEGLGSWVDSECASALEAVGLAEAERGHLRGR